jgi:hypothetical protein
VQDGTLRYNHYAGGWQSVVGTHLVADDQWHHVAVTHDQATGQVVLYEDGEIDATGQISYGATYAAVNCIGAGYQNLDAFAGLLDEVAVYNHPLEPDEVLGLFATGMAGQSACLHRGIGQSADTIRDTFDTIDDGALAWRIYDYDGGFGDDRNVFYPVTWEASGGVGDSGYVWGDDSCWRIDTPESPDSILAFLTYRAWEGKAAADLRGALASVYLRGDSLDLKGGDCYFWVVDNEMGTRWHFVAHPLTVGVDAWGTRETFILTNDESLWHRTWARDPGNPASLDQVLSSVDSYGFSLLGFSEEVTGRFAMDQLEIVPLS